ncbi:hypothetical protein SBRY_30052 [Actinacidiphila bryophytorum]|uniref:Uncharacterized protein n=1 Tax=Actinacidiphila bryophytorum TaxID=1436133 RepID=A0A9W4H0B8_9ACTN|nr:hypothetical protein SBRY_30052 [Actinacidiphila bryophytorum]
MSGDAAAVDAAEEEARRGARGLHIGAGGGDGADGGDLAVVAGRRRRGARDGGDLQPDRTADRRHGRCGALHHRGGGRLPDTRRAAHRAGRGGDQGGEVGLPSGPQGDRSRLGAPAALVAGGGLRRRGGLLAGAALRGGHAPRRCRRGAVRQVAAAGPDRARQGRAALGPPGRRSGRLPAHRHSRR